MNATDLLMWGGVAHLVVDFLFQKEWIALHKTSLRYPAAWVHGGLHLLCAALVLPLWAAALLSAAHMLIDMRYPLAWWRRVMR